MKVVSERWVMGTCGLLAASAAAAALASLLASCFQGLASTSWLACSSSCRTAVQAQIHGHDQLLLSGSCAFEDDWLWGCGWNMLRNVAVSVTLSA